MHLPVGRVPPPPVERNHSTCTQNESSFVDPTPFSTMSRLCWPFRCPLIPITCNFIYQMLLLWETTAEPCLEPVLNYWRKSIMPRQNTERPFMSLSSRRNILCTHNPLSSGPLAPYLSPGGSMGPAVSLILSYLVLVEQSMVRPCSHLFHCHTQPHGFPR